MWLIDGAFQTLRLKAENALHKKDQFPACLSPVAKNGKKALFLEDHLKTVV